MDYIVDDLPLHVLLVHAVIVLVPLVGLALIVIAAWPAARRVLWLPVLIAAVLLVPLGLVTIEAGKWLQARVPAAPLIEAHTSIGESIVPWLWALLGVAVLVSAWAVIELLAARRSTGTEERRPSRGLRIAVNSVLTVAALAVTAGAGWTVFQIGESGSRAVWEGSFSDEPLEQ
ncbi:DUF2231 domain-containing protein [Agromyces mariniharenae]|uniref:Uncharacterized protein n=1 Tax=Agromyces mariniharenae TaxID=2604423 RepID=A0A5S4UVX7_9MICO|nr:DUF2231 domain-containing protein [Agromyces mariniharenae]TYL50702.1 hypothetical protein FYC51_16185 [Agromyces mariniharenae]